MKFPRMSTWNKKYGPFTHTDSVAGCRSEFVLSICNPDEGDRALFGVVGKCYVNTSHWLLNTHPMPLEERDNINVVGICQAGLA